MAVSFTKKGLRFLVENIIRKEKTAIPITIHRLTASLLK